MEAPRTGKGHATPTRKEAQAARYRPIVTDDRKAARQRAREAREAAFQKQQYALEHNIETGLPARDRGKARQFARDYIDAGFNLGETFMPVALGLMVAVLVLSAIQQREWYLYTTAAMYLAVFLGLGHAAFVSFRMYRELKKYVPEDEIPKGTVFYAFQRAFQVRRWRLPRPRVARGEWPQEKLHPLA